MLKRLGIPALRDQCTSVTAATKCGSLTKTDFHLSRVGWVQVVCCPLSEPPRLLGTPSMICLVPAQSSGLMFPAKEAPRCHPKNQEKERGGGCSLEGLCGRSRGGPLSWPRWDTSLKCSPGFEQTREKEHPCVTGSPTPASSLCTLSRDRMGWICLTRRIQARQQVGLPSNTPEGT